MSTAASGLLGRAFKLRRKGRKREALEAARKGLVLLRPPSSHRCDGVESAAAHSTQTMLTVQVEQLAHELGTPGADPADLAHVVGFLRALPPEVKGAAADLRSRWLPYLEQRLAQVAGNEGSNRIGE